MHFESKKFVENNIYVTELIDVSGKIWYYYTVFKKTNVLY